MALLRSIGNGLQSVYLTRLPESLAAALIDLIGVEARDIIRGNLLPEGVGDWIPAYGGMTRLDPRLRGDDGYSSQSGSGSSENTRRRPPPQRERSIVK